MAKKSKVPGKADAKAVSKAEMKARMAATAAAVRHPIKAATLLYSAPGVILRGPIYMMFVTMITLFIYSTIATKDTLVVAPVKLQRQSVTVQAISGGLVESVDVGENSIVYAGAPLVTIKEKLRAASTPEQEMIDRERRDYEQRRETENRDYNFRRSQAESELVDLRRRTLTNRDAAVTRIGQLENQLATTRSNRATAAVDLANAEKSAARLEPLCAQRDIPITQCEAARQQVSNVRRSLTNIDSDIRNIELSLKTARDDADQQANQQSIERLEAQLKQMEIEHGIKLKQIDDRITDLDIQRTLALTTVPGVRPGLTPDDRDKLYYHSVIDGIVTAVHVQRGQLISPGSQLVTTVRNTAPLEARILIQNKDIGLLKIGQAVQLKYFAYPFQEYGIHTGSIADISTRPSTAPGEESLYVVHVALENETIRSRSGVEKPLEIGLQGLAEIKTGEKRFIELLFAPASKFFQANQEENNSGSAINAPISGAGTADNGPKH